MLLLPDSPDRWVPAASPAPDSPAPCRHADGTLLAACTQPATTTVESPRGRRDLCRAHAVAPAVPRASARR